MSSISGTATTQLPVPFSLPFYGALGSQLDKKIATQRKDEAARQRDALRKARYEVELLAAEYAKVMLERDIFAALDPLTDPALAHKIRQAVQNRGIGRVRTQEDDEDAKKQKGGNIEGFLDMLTAISAVQSAIEHTPPAANIRHTERDITPSDTGVDLQQLLDDLNSDMEVDDA